MNWNTSLAWRHSWTEHLSSTETYPGHTLSLSLSLSLSVPQMWALHGSTAPVCTPHAHECCGRPMYTGELQHQKAAVVSNCQQLSAQLPRGIRAWLPLITSICWSEGANNACHLYAVVPHTAVASSIATLTSLT
jgi:hypothetical protein